MNTPDGSFVFIIPVRNPDDEKVQDYGTIELLLKQTITSLISHDAENVHVIVVCHRIPEFAAKFPKNVKFLDVGNIPVFLADRNSVRVDKGLKYIIGILYAKSFLNPAFIMPMDADDYVHKDIVQYIQKYDANNSNENLDGYLIHKGVHVLLDVEQGQKIAYQGAYHIFGFNVTCGSCRVFVFTKLMKKIISQYPDLLENFLNWNQPDINNSICIESKPVEWFDAVSRGQYNNETSIVNALGRHMNQCLNFKFEPINFIGAAKGCGHGNHDGPKKGEVHENRIIGIYNLKKFISDFGLNGNANISKKTLLVYDILSFPKYYLINRIKYYFSNVNARLTNKNTY